MGIQLFKASFDVEACLAQVRECLEKGWTGMGYKTVNAEGAFYVFPKIEDPDFVKKAADAGVITVPGFAFGSNGEGHIRMSYANSYENIERAMDILEEMN